MFPHQSQVGCRPRFCSWPSLALTWQRLLYTVGEGWCSGTHCCLHDTPVVRKMPHYSWAFVKVLTLLDSSDTSPIGEWWCMAAHDNLPMLIPKTLMTSNSAGEDSHVSLPALWTPLKCYSLPIEGACIPSLL